MYKLQLFLCFLITVQVGVAQKKKNKVTTFAKSITEADLKKHLTYIAGPETEGRGTGTPGIAKAANYIENEFKKYGLQPGNGNNYQLEYTLIQDSIEDGSIIIGNKSFIINEHFSANFRSNITQELQTHFVVYAGYGIKENDIDDYKIIDAKGKVVIVEEGEPMLNDSAYVLSGTKRRSEWSNANMNKKAALAQQLGAIAIFTIAKKYTKAPKWPIKRSGFTPEFRIDKNTINRYVISTDIATALLETTTPPKGLGLHKDMKISLRKKVFKTPSSNVIGILPGTEKKDEYIVITAHMDHLGMRDGVIYYGADDDGSGTCAVMEIAEAFAIAKKAGKEPRRTIVFMTVSGEEMGLWGSKYYADNPVYPLEKTSVNLNIDMIGRVGSDYIKDAPDSLNYVYVIGDDKLSSDLRPISEEANKSVNLKLDYRYNDPNDKNRFYYRSDHYNFAEKGVPIIFYFDGVHKDYHKPTDTVEKINYDLYEKRARLVFYTAWLMANKDEMLKRDIPLK